MTRALATPAPRSAPAALRRCSLAALIRRIAKRRERQALRELHDHRTPFCLGAGPALPLAVLLGQLCDEYWVANLCGHDAVAVDDARGLTLAKFSQWPRRRRSGRSVGPDCSLYFQGFLDVLSAWRRKLARPLTALQEEQETARLLQKYVLHQFRLSCLELRRARQPARTRFTWRLPGGALVLLMPTELAHGARRKWLEEHIPHPDPTRPGEQENIQKIIDGHWGVPHRVPWGVCMYDASAPGRDGRLLHGPTTPAVDLHDLAQTVADEKVANFKHLRPAWRALGRAGVRRFVLRAFRDLRHDRYQENQLAAHFKCDRALVSRVAGIHWRTRPDALPPALWANLGAVAAGCEEFVAAAKATRLWPRVQRAAAAAKRNGPRRRRDV